MRWVLRAENEKVVVWPNCRALPITALLPYEPKRESSPGSSRAQGAPDRCSMIKGCSESQMAPGKSQKELQVETNNIQNEASPTVLGTPAGTL